MTVPPVIQLIHASDAPHHAAELKTIMMRMKSENRISDLVVQDITLEPFSLSLKTGTPGGIVILLTHEVEPSRKEIEHLIGVNRDVQQFKLIEIIVDNVPYNNHFISFPQDLKPIRSRDDMNLVWKGIEQDLELIFPRVFESQIIEPKKQPVDLKKYLKLMGVSVLAVMLCNGILEVLQRDISDENRTILNIFSFFLPSITFLRHKKGLEQPTLATGELQHIRGVIHWKQLFIKIAIALLFLFVIYFGSALMLIFLGILPGILPPFLAIVGTLLFIFYKRKAASFPIVRSSEDNQSSPAKRFFGFFGALVLYFLLSAIFWIIITENFFQVIPEKDTFTLILTVITTFFWMFFRARRKRTKTHA